MLRAVLAGHVVTPRGRWRLETSWLCPLAGARRQAKRSRGCGCLRKGSAGGKSRARGGKRETENGAGGKGGMGDLGPIDAVREVGVDRRDFRDDSVDLLDDSVGTGRWVVIQV